MKRPHPRSRGWVTLATLTVIGGLTALTAVGMSARNQELGFEDRSLMRAQARWAAESALLHAQIRTASGSTLEGQLPGNKVCTTVTYRARITQTRAYTQIEATGTCTARDDRPARANITVRTKDGQLLFRQEAPQAGLR